MQVEAEENKQRQDAYLAQKAAENAGKQHQFAHTYYTLLYCCTAALLHCFTAVLLYCCTAALLHCCTALTLYNTLSLYYTLTLYCIPLQVSSSSLSRRQQRGWQPRQQR
jgi:hypothetical protein